MRIALESFYASVGEDKEQLGRTYLRIQEIGTFASDTPYPVVRDRINETVKAEQTREKKSLDYLERSVERRKQLQR